MTEGSALVAPPGSGQGPVDWLTLSAGQCLDGWGFGSTPSPTLDRLADRREYLRTEGRIDRVTEPLVHRQLPLGTHTRFRIPSGGLIHCARQAALRFTFDTNTVNTNVNQLEYCLERIDSCGLTAEDMLTPGQTGSLPAPWVACAEVSR